MGQFKSVFLVAASGFVLAGCSSTKSENVKSAGVYASNSVVASEGKVTCTTSLQVGGSTGTYLELTGSDQLYCNGVKMEKTTSLLNQITYSATVSSKARAFYKIQFARGDETMSATAMLPSAISGVQIEAGPTQKIGSPFRVSWTPSAYDNEGAVVSLILQNQHQDQSGLAALKDTVPETGRVAFAPRDTVIQRYNDKTQAYEKVDGPYAGQVEVRRTLDGTMQGAWTGGMSASQSVLVNASFR